MHTEFDQTILHYHEHDIDDLALDGGVRAMMEAPRIAQTHANHVPIVAGAPVRDLLSTSFQHVPLKHKRPETDELPTDGLSLTYWMKVDPHKPKDREAAELTTFKTAKDFCRALRHRYQMPLKAAYSTFPTADGHRLMAVTLATDSKHAMLLEDEVLPTIKDALADSRRTDNLGWDGTQALDTVHRHFPEARPTPEIDALRDEAMATEYMRRPDSDVAPFTSNQANRALRDFMANKVGIIGTARTNREGNVQVPEPFDHDHFFKPRITKNFQLEEHDDPVYHNTKGLVLWLDPKLHGDPRRANETMALSMRDQFRQALFDMFPGYGLDVHVLNLTSDPEKPLQPNMGMLIRAPREYQRELHGTVKHMLERCSIDEGKEQTDERRFRTEHPRIASGPTNSSKGR